MLNETRWTKENLTKKLMIKNSYITIHTTQPVALIFKADVAFWPHSKDTRKRNKPTAFRPANLNFNTDVQIELNYSLI